MILEISLFCLFSDQMIRHGHSIKQIIQVFNNLWKFYKVQKNAFEGMPPEQSVK